jgi:hypothetical protein
VSAVTGVTVRTQSANGEPLTVADIRAWLSEWDNQGTPDDNAVVEAGFRSMSSGKGMLMSIEAELPAGC